MPDLSDLHLCVEPSLIDRLRKNISDNMPTGSHRERARAWATLARRCQSASEAHQRVADERDATRVIVRSFAPAYRSAVLSALQAGVDVHFNGVPEGYDVADVVPDMSPEDFKALCEEQAQKIRAPKRALTTDEVLESSVWTGRFYRALTSFELRSGRTFEPTLAELTEDEQTP